MKLINRFLNILFPSKCISCNSIISHDANFCVKCWKDLQFIKSPHCRICCYPFEIQIYQNNHSSQNNIDNNICLNCLKKPPFFDKTISVFRYNSTIGKAIGSLKYRDQTYLVQKFVKILSQYAKYEIIDCDIICAVPLHKNKLKIRKFNQSTLIAQKLCSEKFIYDLVLRTKNQISQVKLTQKQRISNIKKSFQVKEKYLELIKNKKILLIDDVITTSATVNSIAKELKKNGAQKVVVVTLAKTIFK